ncbi:MAG: prolyl oligopeptidase family serine peptidase [Candidatus Omnitrophica bacterium]|nr:prolyl oligopeptidase family serine peptidase [Candidatus Omnitrophota bacterium]
MNTPDFTEKIFDFMANGINSAFAVRIPKKRCDRAVLLISLATDWYTALNNPDYKTVPDIFLSAGHNVASFDLPGHGSLIDYCGEGIESWAKAMLKGVDVAEKIRNIGSKIIDICLEERLAWNQTVVMMGVSRGGFSVLHIMAYDRRVYAAAIHAPVIDLAELREFRDVKENELVISSSGMNLIPFLASRFLFISMGQEDPRVDAKTCFEFFARLCASSKTVKPELFVLRGQTHGPTAYTHSAYSACASFLLGKIAIRINEKTHQD